MCVGPRHATQNVRGAPFEILELLYYYDAHVAVLGFKINGVSIDLLYANLAHVVIPKVSLSYCIAV
jgi:poly(A) polymerase